MTILLSVPSRQYTPQTINRTFVLATGVKRLLATLTRESWPVGSVASITVNFPDGTLASAVTLDGGDQFDRGGNLIVKNGVEIDGKWFNGVQDDLPAGTWGAVIVINQTVTTAVTVETA